MNVKRLIKEHVKFTYAYQYRAAHKYFKNTSRHFGDLEIDERSRRNTFICNKNNKTKQIVDMFDSINITIREGNIFQTWIDTGLYIGNLCSMTDNTSPKYDIILENSIQDLKNNYVKKSGEFYSSQYSVLEAVERYIIRIIKTIDDVAESIGTYDEKLKVNRRHFERMLTQKAETLDEALQRILFWSSLFWQSQHMLVGLGRLDKLLDRYVKDNENVTEILKEFYKEIHRYYAFKSGPVSLGDTGQIIVVGGNEKDGDYFCNQLTRQMIIAMRECRLPDPKILLRVSDNMPKDLLELAVECIQTGIGCPLLANDDVIIPALLDFGYEEDDAYDYVTSACWEPLAYGKSLEKNNLKIINFAEPLTKVLNEFSAEELKDFQSLLDAYTSKLSDYIDELIVQLENIQWEEDPLMSIFVKDCLKKGVDISEGGAKYSDYGVLSVGLSNTINSLLNIKNLSFKEKKYSVSELIEAANADYEGFETIKKELQNNSYFGKDNEQVISLTKHIVDVVAGKFEYYKNPLNGRVKFGLSASNYVEAAENTEATLDGRNKNKPLRAHITSSGDIAFTELINFASSLDYSGVKSNGNVVDFFVAPTFLQDNFNKFIGFLTTAIKSGFFEMQMNVVDSATLIEAKKHPEKYQNLIVRVWGFSAYFKDLPESYQNVLIERAISSEGAA